MTISQKVREQMLELCGSICDDDGLDARKFHETKKEQTKTHEYRRQRLCQQVGRTLAFVLPGSTVEPIRALQIDRVVPGKNASVLTVKIIVPDGADRETQRCLLDALKQQEGWLRAEIATAVTRKRVPGLTFEFAHNPESAEEVRDD